MEDTSKKKVTFTDWGIAFKGFNMGITGVNVNLNGVGVTVNASSTTVTGLNTGFNVYSLTGTFIKLDLYNVSLSMGVFSTTQTVFTWDNQAQKIENNAYRVNLSGLTVFI